MSVGRSVVEVGLGKYAGNQFSAPRFIDKITNAADKRNAVAVFGVLLVHFDEDPKIRLIEVDDFVHDGVCSYWRLCAYGLDCSPSAGQITQLMADMLPVQPLKIFFESQRRSRTLIKGAFMVQSLTVHMPATNNGLIVKLPSAMESERVVDYSPMEKRTLRASALLRRAPVSTKRSKEDAMSRAEKRFKTRSFLGAMYDFALGVSFESVAAEIAAREESAEPRAVDTDDLY